MTTKLLNQFKDNMLTLNWEVDVIYPDTDTLSMLYKMDSTYVWCMFNFKDFGDNFRCHFQSDVSYYDFNDCVQEITGRTNQYALAKSQHWDVNGVLGSKTFFQGLSIMIIEWANSVDIALWLQHVADHGSGMPHNQIYAAVWYGKTEFIEKTIIEAETGNKDRHYGLTQAQLSKALEIAQKKRTS